MYTIRTKWDRKKRPQRLTVEIKPTAWQAMTRAQRREVATEISFSVGLFMDELRRKLRVR